MAEMQSVTTLYRMYDADGALLYAGIAADPGRRFVQHKATKSWWDQVVSLRLEHYDSRQEAMAAEVAAIRNEHPKWNVVGRQETSWDLLCSIVGEPLPVLEIVAMLTVSLCRGMWPDFTPAEGFNGSDRMYRDFGPSVRDRMLDLVGPWATSEVSARIPRLRLPETADQVFDRLKATMQREFDTLTEEELAAT